MTREDIDSESKFFWKFFFYILLTPITLTLILFGRKKWGDLLQPFKYCAQYFFQPKFTAVMILANVFCFFGSLFLSEKGLLSLTNRPSDLLSGQFYTLFTAGFLHANILHLVGNMIGLFIFGRVVEKKLGFVKTGFIYFGALLLSGVFNALIGILSGDNTPGIGASGALMGLVATAILVSPFYITQYLIIPLPIMAIGWLFLYADIMGILSASNDGIGHFAHLGGFISIALLSYFLGVADRDSMKRGLWMNVISFAVLSVFLYYFYIR